MLTYAYDTCEMQQIGVVDLVARELLVGLRDEMGFEAA
jgi:hypothetical protein